MKNILKLIESFPRKDRFSLSNQITGLLYPFLLILQKEAAEIARKIIIFFEHSLGSAFELETQLLIADAVNFGDQSIHTKMMQDVLDKQKMPTSFMSKLNK